MLVKVANKDTESVISGLIKSAQRLPRELYKSLTWDRGKEPADHPRLTIATDIDVYFCDPHSRGNAVRTKTPTGFSGNICQGELIYPFILKQSSARSHVS